MNERKFLKLINSKKNLGGMFTYTYFYNLLEESSTQLDVKRSNAFVEFFNKFRKPKSVEQIISDNFELILDKLPNEYIKTFLERLVDDFSNIATSNFDSILKKINNASFNNYILRNFLKSYTKKSQENVDFVKNNLKLILDYATDYELFYIITDLKEMNADSDILNSKFEEKKTDICRNWIKNALLFNFTSKQINEAAKYDTTLMIIIEELLKSENKRWIDIERKGEGVFSNVLKIGDKVLKIGYPRNKYEIPDHPRICKSLTRTNLLDSREETVACIEIMEEVEMKESITEEELYEVYKELREDGIVWTDVKLNNVGRLKKDNKTYLNGEEFYVDPNSVGIKERDDGKTLDNEKVLKAGDIVIIDTDYIYYDNDPNIKWGNNYLSAGFENRYQNEKAKEVVKEHQERLQKTSETASIEEVSVEDSTEK